MAIRAEYDNVVLSTPEGEPMANVEANVYDQGTTNLATIYATRTGGGTLANPITTGSNGNVQFWAEPDSYDIKFHDTVVPARFSDRTVTWEAISGDIAGGIDGSQLEDGAITTAKLGNSAVTTITIDDDAVTNAKIGANAISRNEIQNNEVINSKIGGDAIDANKIADDAVRSEHIQALAVTPGKYVLGTQSDIAAGSLQSITGTSYQAISGITIALTGWNICLCSVSLSTSGTCYSSFHINGSQVGPEIFTQYSNTSTLLYLATTTGTLTLRVRNITGNCTVWNDQVHCVTIRIL